MDNPFQVAMDRDIYEEFDSGTSLVTEDIVARIIRNRYADVCSPTFNTFDTHTFNMCILCGADNSLRSATGPRIQRKCACWKWQAR